jgi:hypothetical protein
MLYGAPCTFGGYMKASLGLAAALLLTGWAFTALAAVPDTAEPGICTKLSDAIDGNLRLLSSSQAENVGDDSAPRNTMRLTEENVLLSEIQGNIALMSAHRCAPYAHTIDRDAYLSDAIKCNIARLSSNTEDVKAACNGSNWRRITP